MRVAIIGDGISSLTLAKALINENIYVDIFTTKKKNILNKSRTIGISKSNIEYFNSNILNIDKIIWKIKYIEIFSENLKEEKLINFKSNDKGVRTIQKVVKDLVNKLSFIVSHQDENGELPFKTSFELGKKLTYPIKLTSELLNKLLMNKDLNNIMSLSMMYI